MFRGGEDVLTRGKAEIRVGRCHVCYIRPPGIPQEFLKFVGSFVAVGRSVDVPEKDQW